MFSIYTAIFMLSLIYQDKFEHSKWTEKEKQPTWNPWPSDSFLSKFPTAKEVRSTHWALRVAVNLHWWSLPSQISLQVTSLSTWLPFYTTGPKTVTQAQDTQLQKKAVTRGMTSLCATSICNKTFSWGHEVILGSDDNLKWEEDQWKETLPHQLLSTKNLHTHCPFKPCNNPPLLVCALFSDAAL